MRIICVVSFLLLVALAGCNTSSLNPPLIFGTVTDLGIAAAAGTAEQGVNLTVGYRSQRIAIIPVTVCCDALGQTYMLYVTDGAGGEGGFDTFAHFQMTTGAGAQGANACLGDVFATGIAARYVARNLPVTCNPATTAATAAAIANQPQP